MSYLANPGRYASLAGLAFALAVASTTGNAAPPYPPGQYELTWQTVMPHLDEMRLRTTRATRCLAGTADRLFPILEQPALTGCTLSAPGAGHHALTCRSARVASGRAAIAVAGAHVEGDLAVTMGGKNMTFSQHVDAERRGDCAAGR